MGLLTLGLKIIEELIELTPFLKDLTSISLLRRFLSSSTSKSLLAATISSRRFSSCCLSDERDDEADEIGVVEKDMDDMDVGLLLVTTRLVAEDSDERQLSPDVDDLFTKSKIIY